MRIIVILALLAFWLVLASRALQKGDTTMAAILTTVGVALTVYRLRLKGPQNPPSA